MTAIPPRLHIVPPPPNPQRSGSSRPRLPVHKGLIRTGKAAAHACAVGAGFGLATGMLSRADGIVTGYAVPIVAGGVMACAAACGWHMLMTSAGRVRTPRGYLTILSLTVLLALGTIGAASWGVATSLSGKSAVRAYLADTLASESQALETAWAGAQHEAQMIDATLAAATEMRGLSTIEAQTGALSKNRKGDGPAAKLLVAAADDYEQMAERMRRDFQAVQRAHDRGKALLRQQQQTILHAPDGGFAALALDLQDVIGELNAFSLTGMPAQGGISKVEVTTDGRSGTQVRSGAEAITQKLLDRAQHVAETRTTAVVPAFTPIEPREATLRYATSASVGGWVTAVGIDLLPALFVLLILGTALEPFILGGVEHAPPPPDIGPHPDHPSTWDKSYLAPCPAPQHMPDATARDRFTMRV